MELISILVTFVLDFISLDINELKWLDIKVIDVDDFLELLIRFALNTFIIILIVRYIYYRKARRKDHLFTYILISVIIFLLCHLLENVKLELGFALGLFAIFGIIRYRTSQIEIKEMTYLFLVIGISVINALANKKVSHAELWFSNIIIVIITWSLEYLFLMKHESQKLVIFEKIELIKPERHTELIADLEKRTGIKIHRIEIGKIDFMRDVAQIKVFYMERNQLNPASISSGNSGDDD